MAVGGPSSSRAADSVLGMKQPSGAFVCGPREGQAALRVPPFPPRASSARLRTVGLGCVGPMESGLEEGGAGTAGAGRAAAPVQLRRGPSPLLGWAPALDDLQQPLPRLFFASSSTVSVCGS